jgi:TPR repeat protein
VALLVPFAAVAGVNGADRASTMITSSKAGSEHSAGNAQYNLGMRYAQGRGVTKDEMEAVKWYRKAAEQSKATAQFNLDRRRQATRFLAQTPSKNPTGLSSWPLSNSLAGSFHR